MLIGKQGTEIYIPISNLGKMTISDFKVSDESGLQYQLMPEWDVDASREQKSGKCGIVNVGNGGYELCWGLGSLDGASTKEKLYTVSYKLSGLVKAYQDADGFNHMFVNPEISPTPDSVSVTFHAPHIALDSTNTKIWAFGYYGQIIFNLDGTFTASSTEPFAFKHSVIVMAGFNKGVFEIPIEENQELGLFEDVKKRAFEGSAYEQAGPKPKDWVELSSEKICNFFGMDVGKNAGWIEGTIVWSVLGLIVIIFIYLKSLVIKPLVYILSLKPLRVFLKRRKAEKKVEWFRAIPFNGSIASSQRVLNNFTYKSKPSINNAVSAYMMRLFNNGYLTIVEDNGNNAISIVKGVIDKTERTNTTDTTIEQAILSILNHASGNDNILQPKELKSYMKKNYTSASPLRQLTETAKITNTVEQDKLLGLKKFLKDFTLVGERNVGEVKLWNEYLVFATLFGMAKQVRKDFKQICPEYFQMSRAADMVLNNSVIVDSLISNFSYGTSRALRRIERKEFWDSVNSYSGSSSGYSSSGGGGRSSYSGGGGYSGGGRGGGVR